MPNLAPLRGRPGEKKPRSKAGLSSRGDVLPGLQELVLEADGKR